MIKNICYGSTQSSWLIYEIQHFYHQIHNSFHWIKNKVQKTKTFVTEPIYWIKKKKHTHTSRSVTWISETEVFWLTPFQAKCNAKPSFCRSFMSSLERALNCHTRDAFTSFQLYTPLKTTSDWAHKTCIPNDKMRWCWH